MLPIELRLASHNNCYVQLPNNFIEKETNLKPGSIVSIRSIQSDHEICVIWDGQVTPGDFAQLDLDFASGNNLKDELVLIAHMSAIEKADCSKCRVELIDATDYTILSQHIDIRLLDSCRLVYPDLVIPVPVAQHVKVVVKVIHIEPRKNYGMLTQWTEMEFHHNLSNIPHTKADNNAEELPITDQVPMVSCSIGLVERPKFYLGSLLVIGEPGAGKTHYLKTLLDKYSKFRGSIYDCKKLRGKRPESVKKILTELIDNACVNQPYILAFDDIDSILPGETKHEAESGQEPLYIARLGDIFRQLFLRLEQEVCSGKLISMVATCRSRDSLDKRFSKPKGRKYFNKFVRLDAPGQIEKQHILKDILGKYENFRLDMTDEQFLDICKRTTSFMPVDLKMIAERSVINACSRSTLEFDCDLTKIQHEDFLESIKNYVPINLRDVPLQTKTPRDFSQVGGMKDIKDQLIKMVLFPMKYSKLYNRCPIKLQRSVLLYGPPGCGKSLIADALINQENLNSIAVRGPELLSKYIGASEAAVRNLFRHAYLARPCVLFFDEFESLVAKRGADSTGVTDRIVNQFLTLMDGSEGLSDEIFIIATTSRPDMIDPAIMRKGRLDKHIYCALPDEHDRKEIIEVLSSDINLAKIDMSDWALRLEGFTGADIKSLLFAAQLRALHEEIGPIDFDNISNSAEQLPEKLDILVQDRHLSESFDEMKDEVAERSKKVQYLYPKNIGQRADRVAVRATLR